MSISQTSNIRNFCVIAHIDHGKSTLCDRFLEITKTVEKRSMEEQLLDSNPIERERGITIKLAPVRMIYRPNSEFILNLIDTPGHIDFSYEVSRSLAACEGAILVVDATQGVEAQTISNTLAAINQGLVIIPVINKIDLPNANIEKTKEELKNIFGFKDEEILLISAKTGENCENVLLEVIRKIPPPIPDLVIKTGNNEFSSEKPEKLRALIFNSFYDSFKGVVIAIKIVSGEFDISDFQNENTLKFLGTKGECLPIECGYFKPKMEKGRSIKTGEVGYIATGLKDLKLCRIGDTIADNWDEKPLPGYAEIKHFVFAGVYPLNENGFLPLKTSLEKLMLTDSSLSVKPVTSKSLGNGFHVGFLGLLHADIVKERLLREFNQEVILASPTVEYKIILTNKEEMLIDNPINFPDVSKIEKILEPIVNVSIFTPKKYIGGIISLCEDGRGQMLNFEYYEDTVNVRYKMPYQEIITDYYDKLKSVSQGYASLSYDFVGFEEADIVKIDILLNGQIVDALSFMVERSKAQKVAKSVIEKLKNAIPRQQFAVSVQAAIGAKIIARGDINPFRKDVLKKMSGGDRTRKDKLLEAQKKGKKRMKLMGSIEIPPSAFLEVFQKT